MPRGVRPVTTTETVPHRISFRTRTPDTVTAGPVADEHEFRHQWPFTGRLGLSDFQSLGPAPQSRFSPTSEGRPSPRGPRSGRVTSPDETTGVRPPNRAHRKAAVITRQTT